MNSSVHKTSDLSARNLRDALGMFSTGVCLITMTDEHGVAHALTVNSFASVSLDPPLVLWSLQNDSDVFSLFSAAPRFAIAVLSKEQESLSNLYARKGAHAMHAEHFSLGANGAPLVSQALVNFECELERSMDGGDHTILLGRVTKLVSGLAKGETASPLVFFAGSYRQLL